MDRRCTVVQERGIICFDGKMIAPILTAPSQSRCVTTSRPLRRKRTLWCVRYGKAFSERWKDMFKTPVRRTVAWKPCRRMRTSVLKSVMLCLTTLMRRKGAPRTNYSFLWATPHSCQGLLFFQRRKRPPRRARS